MTAIQAHNVPFGAEFDRTPPHDLAAEQCVLGGMLLSGDAISDVIDILQPGDYYRPTHQLIHDAIISLYEKGEPAEPVAVLNVLAKRGELTRIGEPTYLHTLVATVPTAANAGYYARIVREKAILRRLVEVGTRIVQLSYAGDADAEELAERARAEVDSVTALAVTEPAQSLDELFMEVTEQLTQQVQPGVPYPWVDVNDVTQGLTPGALVVLAAVTSAGKSVGGLQIAANAAIKHGIPSVVFSMEMSRAEIMLRLISARGKIPFHTLMSRQVESQEDWERIADAREQICKAPLTIDDNPVCSLGYAERKLRELARTGEPPGLAVVDYVQLMPSPDRAENRQVAVSSNMRGLKVLAGKLGIPILAISQLSRNPYLRNDKRPILSDLRESGDVENHAGTVILLHREDMFEVESPRAGEADLIIAKNRNGPRGITVTVAFQGHYQRLVDMAVEPSPPPPPRQQATAEADGWTPSSVLGGRR